MTNILREGEKGGFYWDGDNAIENLEILRSAIKKKHRGNYIEADWVLGCLSSIIEIDLRDRLAEQKPAEKFLPAQKQKLEEESKKYKEYWRTTQDWLNYYMDKDKGKAVEEPEKAQMGNET